LRGRLSNKKEQGRKDFRIYQLTHMARDNKIKRFIVSKDVLEKGNGCDSFLKPQKD
jgi:hypothetical protein